MRCWQCGAQMPHGEHYCPECFAEIEDTGAGDNQAVCCPGCGTRCDSEDRVCPACGNPLDDAVLPPDEDEV